MAFKLEKILGSQTNAPEMFVDVPCGTDTETTWEEGVGIRVDDSVVSVAYGKNAAQFIVTRTVKTKSASDIIPCYIVTTDMIFRVPVATNYNASTFKVGLSMNVLPNGKQFSPTASTWGNSPVIVDTLGATKAKDEMLVKYMTINTVKLT